MDQKLYVSDTEAENFLSTEVEPNLSSGEIAIMHLKVPFNDEIGKDSSSVAAQEILASLIENKVRILENENSVAMNLRIGAGENMTEL